MSIQRVPEVPFAQIANTALRDKRLSFKARGLLALVLSNVGEWDASRDWLIDQSEKDGLTAIQSALNELTELGYRTVIKEQGPDGLFTTTVIWLQIPEIDRPMENPTVGLSDGPETRRSIEHHPSEDHKEHHRESSISDSFSEFYKAYPRKKHPATAEKAWAKAIKDTDPAVIIAAAVQFRQWCEQDGKEAQFIPHPSTWLNAKAWLDERDPVPMSENERRMQGHLALTKELWDNEIGYPQENPLELEA